MSSTLLKGNCIELMGKLPDKSVDLILCDLPYGVTANKKDTVIPFDLLWKQYERVIKDNGAILLFAQGIFYVDLVNSNRKMFKYDIVWNKVLVTGFLNAKKMPMRQHEQIAVFYKKQPTYNPQFSTRPPLHGRGNIDTDSAVASNKNYVKYKYVPNADTTDRYPTSIITFKKPHASVVKHPTEKSIECLSYLIKTYSNEGDTVLDNCMGSGTTGVACVQNNRNFIGMEIDEYYFDIAKERILNFDNNITCN